MNRNNRNPETGELIAEDQRVTIRDRTAAAHLKRMANEGRVKTLVDGPNFMAVDRLRQRIEKLAIDLGMKINIEDRVIG